MSKRFTDTEKWSDPWFRALSPEMKCFWLYLCDNCDFAGIWKVDVELAAFQIGAELDHASIEATFIDCKNPRIRIVSDEKWWIVKFCEFQYSDLSSNKPVVVSIRARLEKLGLLGTIPPPGPAVDDNPANAAQPTAQTADEPTTRPASKTKKTAGAGEYSQEFEVFWNAYPRYRRTGKGKAWDAWQRAKNRPSLDVIMEVLERYKETDGWQKEGGKFVPGPTPWINGRMWDDDPDPDYDPDLSDFDRGIAEAIRCNVPEVPEVDPYDSRNWSAEDRAAFEKMKAEGLKIATR